MEAIIVGAGMGGLSAALALHEKGIGARVFEAAREIRELGVGINVLPHATKELEKLGVLPAMVAQGVLTREVQRFDQQSGAVLTTNPCGRHAGYNWPQVSIHRGRFQRILFDAVRERLGEDRIATDRRFVDFEEGRQGRRSRFEDRDGKTHTATGDVLIAADGIHSRARRIFYPDEGAPVYSGITFWRGVSRVRPFLTGATFLVVGDREQKFLAYPLEAPGADGKCLTNWICELARPEMLAPEDWSRGGRLEDFAFEFEAWRYGGLDAGEVIRSAEAIFEFPMADRNPVPRWSYGRATLLGDAAHPMYPVGSNGASQAVLDAVALAEKLSAISDPAEATYATERLPATARTVQAHRARAQETTTDAAEIEKRQNFRKTVGFDVETVNRG